MAWIVANKTAAPSAITGSALALDPSTAFALWLGACETGHELDVSIRLHTSAYVSMRECEHTWLGACDTNSTLSASGMS